ncbi:guanylate-binding protein 4-like [Pseudorasbora parva]|uniref:guanylate-binding protein 4-like n=1 Tax=Pseudorasbora parva TaxID=51549 RepID=UPI00351E4075
MATVEELLLKALEELTTDKLKKFKWFLKSHGTIPAAVLERKDAIETVDVMVEREGPEGAVKITLDILRKMSENNLAKQLENWTEKKLINQKKDEPRLNSEAYKARLFDKRWSDLVQRVKNVRSIADKLLQQKTIHEEQYSQITRGHLTSADSMREICGIMRSQSDAVKAKFISILQEEEPYLLEDLS